MWSSVDLVTFTEEILNGKLHFLCSDHERMEWLQTKITATSSV